MSKGLEIQVQDLLPSSFDRLAGTLKHDLGDNTLSALPSALYGHAASCMGGQIRDALRIDVLDWLARAWACAVELHKYKSSGTPAPHPAEKVKDPDKDKPQPEETRVLLGEHKLTCVSRPVVNLSFGPHQVRVDRFTVEFEARLTTAALIVNAGYITGVEGGEGEASAVLKFADSALHTPLGPKPVRIPGLHTFPSPGHKIL